MLLVSSASYARCALRAMKCSVCHYFPGQVQGRINIFSLFVNSN